MEGCWVVTAAQAGKRWHSGELRIDHPLAVATALLLEYVCASWFAQLQCRPAVASRPLGCHAGLGGLGDPAGPRVFTAARVAGPGLAACPGTAGLCLAGLIA